MNSPDPSEAWFTLKLTYGEARSLRSQIGDIPKHHAGPRLLALYRDLDARLRLSGSDDEGPKLTIVREKPVVKKDRFRPKYPKPAPRTPPDNPCPACCGEGIVDGVVCGPCRGFGEA